MPKSQLYSARAVEENAVEGRVDDEQREALRKILHGEETEPGTTAWNIFMSTMTTIHEPVYSAIQFEVEVEARQARLVVPGFIESTGEPIRNPMTGDEHRVRIETPNGFEFTVAEMGSATSTVSGAMPIEISESYGQFNNLHLSTHGVVR